MLAKLRSLLQNLGGSNPAPGTGATRLGIRQAGIDRYDVTPMAAELDLTRLQVLTAAPVWMTRAERLMLFSLAFCLRPRSYLEIGTFQGGSALIVANALAALESKARIFCVDPQPKIAPEDWAQLESRAQLFQGYSPQILGEVAQAAGMPFDLVLIDGDHSYTGALRDAQGVLPYVASGGYIVFHDAFHPEVGRAIDHFLDRHPGAITDMGMMTREVTVMHDEHGNEVEWGGLRLVCVH